MKKQNDKYLDLMPKKPKQEEVQEPSSDFDMDLGNSQNSETGFEMDFGNADSGLEGIPTIDLEIGKPNF